MVTKLLRVLILGLGFWLAWHWSLVENLAKPSLAAVLPGHSGRDELGSGSSFSHPRLGVSAPVQESPHTSPLVLADWPKLLPKLRQGLSLSYQAADFGAARLAFLVGHSSDTVPEPYAAIFAGLGQAQVGDQFELRLPSGSYRYQVVERKLLLPS